MADEHRERSPRRKFSPGSKRDEVELVRSSSRPIAEVAEELGLYDSTLASIIRAPSTVGGDA